MGRKRTIKEHKGLPARWRLRGRVYYYQVPAKDQHLWDGRTEFRLGSSLAEAYGVWAERLATFGSVTTFGQLLDRYAAEVVPHKAKKTQRLDIASMTRIKATSFRDAPLTDIKPIDVYQYKEYAGQTSHSYANQDISVISHALTKAVEWGLIDRNPIKGEVIKFGIKPRDRYVDTWEVLEFAKVASPLIRTYVCLKMLTGQRKSDLLGIKLQDLRSDGIHITNRKTGKKIIIEWTEELQAAVASAKQLRGKVSSVWLFCTRRGQPYLKEDGETRGFDSIWQRYMKKALEQTNLKHRFSEHDLRAKVASDTDLDHAVSLLQHSKDEITRKVYRRKGQTVKPAKWPSVSDNGGKI